MPAIAVYSPHRLKKVLPGERSPIEGETPFACLSLCQKIIINYETKHMFQTYDLEKETRP